MDSLWGEVFCRHLTQDRFKGCKGKGVKMTKSGGTLWQQRSHKTSDRLICHHSLALMIRQLLLWGARESRKGRAQRRETVGRGRFCTGDMW